MREKILPNNYHQGTNVYCILWALSSYKWWNIALLCRFTEDSLKLPGSSWGMKRILRGRKNHKFEGGRSPCALRPLVILLPFFSWENHSNWQSGKSFNKFSYLHALVESRRHPSTVSGTWRLSIYLHTTGRFVLLHPPVPSLFCYEAISCDDIYFIKGERQLLLWFAVSTIKGKPLPGRLGVLCAHIAITLAGNKM